MAFEFHAPVAEDVLRDFSKNIHKSTEAQNEALTTGFDAIIDNFIKTAYDAEIVASHRAAATNAICSAIGHAQSIGLRPLTKDRWLNILSVVLDRSDSAKGKSMRQLLGVLIAVLPTFDAAESEAIKNETLHLVFGILISQSDHVKVKPAFQIVSVFFSKKVISLEVFTSRLRNFVSGDLEEDTAPKPDREILQDFAQNLLNWIRHLEAAPAAGQTFCALIKVIAGNEKQIAAEAGAPAPEAFWAEPLISSFSAYPDATANFRHHLLPELFALDIPDYVEFLEKLGFNEWLATGDSSGCNASRMNLLYTSLQVGKETGLILDASPTQKSTSQVHDSKIFISDKAWSRLIRDCSSDVRLAGFSLTICSAVATRPFSSSSIRCLKHNMPHLLMETDAGTRGDVLTMIQRMVDRIKAATSVAHKAANRSKSSPVPAAPGKGEETEKEAPSRTLTRHHNFISWLIRFFRAQLHPEAAYQRHITALRALLLIGKSGLDDGIDTKFLSKQALGDTTWSFHTTIFDPWMIRALYDLVMDPFEDVRTFSAALLEMTPRVQGSLMSSSESTSRGLNFLSKAEEQMLKSGRADHADGVSRTYALLFESASITWHGSQEKEDWWNSRIGITSHLVELLDNALDTAKGNLQLAVTRFPMHGILASLRYILDTPNCYSPMADGDQACKTHWNNLHARLVLALQRVWTCVRDVLCNDAPEGYVPDETVEDEGITTKDILSYSWRALKEASSLIRVIALKAPVGDAGLLSKKEFGVLCALIFTELSELRHRGAFSAVAQAFAACCSRCNSLKHPELLDRLYQDTLACVKAKGSATTRRSAGLPSLITGILGADPGGSLFHIAIKDLQAEAEAVPETTSSYGDPLPQVHALNSLKAIFISTILGPSSEQYIVSTLSISGRCLRSQSWAIRNCGLMLFRALIDRLIGSTDSQNLDDDGEIKPARISYNDYPKLLEIVIELLSPDLDTLVSTEAALESVFPALKIIQRMPPPADQQKSIRALVFKLCESSHWHVRDMAARTFARLVNDAELMSVLSETIPQSLAHQNHVHGRLLCIQYLIEPVLRRVSSSLEGNLMDLEPIYDLFRKQVQLLYRENPCPYTRSSFLDILNRFTATLISSPHLLHNSVLFARISEEESTTMDQPGLVVPEADSEVAEIFFETPSARKSLALHFLLHYVLKIQILERRGEKAVSPLDHFQLILSRLETGDSDAKMQVLEYLVAIAAFLPRASVHVLVATVTRLTERSEDNRVSSKCRRLLKSLYTNVTQDPDLLAHAPSLPSLRGVFKRSPVAAPPLVVNTLSLWGFVMNNNCRANAPTYVLAKEISFLLSFIEQMLHESRSFDLRHASALCLKDFPNLWTLVIPRQDLTPIRVKAMLLTYDILNDDDDEIREVGSQIASQILATTLKKSQVCVPLVASQQLVAHLAKSHGQSEDVCKQAVQKMTTSTLENDIMLPWAKERLQNATAENTALFVVEKQNLFIDQYREAELWSQVLKRLSANAIPTSTASALCTWVCDGLGLLAEEAEAEVDGPLGWTSKAEVFVFGMQVICAADVVLNWRCRTKKVQVEGKVIRALLAKLLSDGNRNEVHGAWLEKIEKILMDAMRKRAVGLGRVSKSIEDVYAVPEADWKRLLS